MNVRKDEQPRELDREMASPEDVSEIERVIAEAKGKIQREPTTDFWAGKTLCWEMVHCPEMIRSECPAATYQSLSCWEIEGTLLQTRQTWPIGYRYQHLRGMPGVQKMGQRQADRDKALWPGDWRRGRGSQEGRGYGQGQSRSQIEYQETKAKGAEMAPFLFLRCRFYDSPQLWRRS